MIVEIDDRSVNSELWQVPDMNFGQMQRWTESVSLEYSLATSTVLFLEKTVDFFERFRKEEIADDDTYDFPELAEYIQQGWSPIKTVLDQQLDLFVDLVQFNDYEILQRLSQPVVDSPCFIPSALWIKFVLIGMTLN